MTTLREVALLRLVAQRLVGPRAVDATDAVRWLTAAQAQDLRGALTSIALRSAAGTRAGVEAALRTGAVVRSWPMRGTLHLVAAEDLRWLLALTTPRLLAGAARRQAELSIDAALLDRSRQLAQESLTGGLRLRRDELYALWQRGGVATDGQRGYHLLWQLAQTGSVCFGPIGDGEQLIVLLDEWVPTSRHLEREEALGELARRYFCSHGPATVKDFSRWTGLVAVDVRTGITLARRHLESLAVDGVEYLMDPRTPELLAACRHHARGVLLLPGFDELVLGYSDRRATVPAEFADRIVPGGNGVFRPTVVSDGQVVGTWKHTGRSTKRTLSATPFSSFPGKLAETIEQVYAALP